jgi:hypothetical protein
MCTKTTGWRHLRAVRLARHRMYRRRVLVDWHELRALRWIVREDLRASGTRHGLMGWVSIEALHAHLFDAIALSAYAASERSYGSKEHIMPFHLSWPASSCVHSTRVWVSMPEAARIGFHLATQTQSRKRSSRDFTTTETNHLPR